MLDNADEIHQLQLGGPEKLKFIKLRKRIVQLVRDAVDTRGMIQSGARADRTKGRSGH